jgi:hypothetical protein
MPLQNCYFFVTLWQSTAGCLVKQPDKAAKKSPHLRGGNYFNSIAWPGCHQVKNLQHHLPCFHSILQ